MTKMKKLEDIPKENFYSVPDGYFEKLPSVVHSRTIGQESATTPGVKTQFRLWYALSAFVFIAALVWFVSTPATIETSDALLASVETADLVAYLTETEMTAEDMLAESVFDDQAVDDLESEVYELSDEEFLYEEFELENQSDTL